MKFNYKKHQGLMKWYKLGMNLGRTAIVTWSADEVQEYAKDRYELTLTMADAIKWLESNEDYIMDAMINAVYKYFDNHLPEDFSK